MIELFKRTNCFQAPDLHAGSALTPCEQGRSPRLPEAAAPCRPCSAAFALRSAHPRAVGPSRGACVAGPPLEVGPGGSIRPASGRGCAYSCFRNPVSPLQGSPPNAKLEQRRGEGVLWGPRWGAQLWASELETGGMAALSFGEGLCLGGEGEARAGQRCGQGIPVGPGETQPGEQGRGSFSAWSVLCLFVCHLRQPLRLGSEWGPCPGRG